MSDQTGDLDKEEKPGEPDETKKEDFIPAPLSWDRLPRLNLDARIEYSSVVRLSQRLSPEVFEQFKHNHSSQEIHELLISQGEDAVVEMAESEAGQANSVWTGELYQPATASLLSPEVSRYQPPEPPVDETEKQRILLSLRRRLGDELYEEEERILSEAVLLKMVATFGEDQAVELMRKAAGAEMTPARKLSTRSTPEEPAHSAPARRPAKKVRTRQMGSTLNRWVLWVALAYAVIIGGFYPDFSAYNQVYDSILPIAAVIFLIVAVINFIRTMRFSLEVILIQTLISSIILGVVFGWVVNVANLGVRSLAAAGIALTGVLLVGMLLGKPIFRWIERRQLEERHGLFVGIGAALGLTALVAGWWGIDYLVKLLFR